MDQKDKKNISSSSYDVVEIEDDSSSNGKLPRTIGFFTGTMICVGSSVGSGIFSVPAIILGEVGSVGMTIICFLLASMIAFFGTLAYCEMGCMRPVSGGEKEYLDYAFKKPKQMLSYMFVTSAVWLVHPGGSAALSIAFGEYMLYAIAGSEQHILESGNAFVIDNKAWIERGFAVFCIVFVALVHSLLPKVGLAIQNGLSVLKLLLLSLLLIIGVTAATGLTSLPRANNFEDLFAGTSTDAHAYSSALLAAFFTSDGWNALNYSLDELVDPVRNLPRASLTSVITVSLLYIAAILSYFMVIPIVDIDTNSAILAGQFFTLTMGEIVGKRIVPVLISLSAFSGVMSGVFGASRLIYAAAREGFFPFKKLFGASTKEGAPIGGLMLHMVMALLLTLAPPPGRIYQFLIDVSAYPSWFFYAMTVTGLLYLRYTEPDTKRPFKSPYLTNVFFVAVCVFVVVVPFVPPEELPTTGIPYYLHALIGITIMLFCIPGWYLQVGRKHYRNQPKGDESDPFAFGSDKEDNKRTHQRDWSTGGDVHSYSPTLVSEEDTS